MKRLPIILSLVLIALLLAGAFGVKAWMDRPLGPPLVLQPPSASPLGDAPPQRSASSQEGTHQGGSPAQPPLAANPGGSKPNSASPASQTGACKGKGLVRLLVIGRASPIQAGKYGADAIRLAVVDYDRHAAAILALPSELWIDTPVLAHIGLEETSLNLVYQKAWESAHGNPDPVRAQKATQALAQTILDNFAFTPDHYLTVEEDAFVEYVDTLGGIHVSLPDAVDGTSQGYGLYPAGDQLLDGARTLNLTRLLHPSGQRSPDIWGSLARQDLVLKGLLAAALQPQNWAKAPGLIKDIRQAITTDLSASQALDLACMAQAVGGSATLLVVGPEMVTRQGGRLLPDLQAIHQLILQMEGPS